MTDPKDVPKLTVAKLRDALKRRGLDTSGLKAALVARLQEALGAGDVAAPSSAEATTPAPASAPEPSPSPKKSPGRQKRKRGASPSPDPEPAPAPAPSAPAPSPPPPASPAPSPAPSRERAEAPADVAPPPPAPPPASDARAAARARAALAAPDSDDDDDDAPALRPAPRPLARSSRECPYLDTVDRTLLDFDFEKCCSVTLSPHNVYACLACGKYFQGRGPNTQAYTHALEAAHHVFMHLDTARVYCLPDAYEILDRSLDDIRRVLNPTFTKEEVANADRKKQWSRALDGSDYLTGAVGLNNLKATDYVNVVVQALNRVAPLRDFFLAGRECSPPTGGVVSEGATRAQPAMTGSSSGSGASSSSLLTRRFGELTRKMWNPRNFKGQVSPHEFMQAAMRSSANRFAADAQSDPVEFLSWFLHAAHRELVKSGRVAKGGQSVVNRCFQGELEVTTVGEEPTGAGGGSGGGGSGDAPATTTRMPFHVLPLDLPPAPLFQDVMEKNAIPQVAIGQILRKFDGVTETESPRGGRKTFRIARLPRFLVVHVKRFARNTFFLEKNPTIVTFPVRGLRLSDHVPTPTNPDGTPANCTYDLLANVTHEGEPRSGAYRAMVFHKADGNWYEMRDLAVDEIVPQQVALAETYLQIYERRDAEEPAPMER